jgi:hypothetical protein
MEDIRYRDDGTPAMVFPPPLAGTTHEEKLSDFARRCMYEDRLATDAEVAAFVSGGTVGTPHEHQAPVVDAVDAADDPWEDAEPQATNADPGMPIAAAETPTQPAEIPPAEADKPPAEPTAQAPVDSAAPTLPPGYSFVRTLPTGEIVALFKDESLPRNPAREVILSPKKLRKLRAQASRAATKMRRALDDGGRKLSF